VLSSAGEQYVDEEIKQALFGVKQMKEMMEKKEEKHAHLMDVLRHSSDKMKVQLARETEQKLQEAEQQCHDSVKTSFEECRPCLEDTCKTFYTSTCRRGFSSFSLKVEEFFRRMATQLGAPEQNEENPDHFNSVLNQNQITEGAADLELLQAEASFSQLLSNISVLYNQSVVLVKRMQEVFGRSFLVAFTAELKPKPLSSTQEGWRAGLFRATDLDHVFDSVYNFGRTVLEEFSSTVADVFEEIHEAEEDYQQSRGIRHLCRQLRRQPSECWQLQGRCEMCEEYLLTECPSMRQLHSEQEELNLLLNASRQQYEGRLQLVQRHTADTQRWLRNMEEQYGWVSQLSNSSLDPHNIFTVITVWTYFFLHQSKADTSVVVTILDAAPVTLSVPAELDVGDPAFIQFVAQEALALHKRRIRGTGPGGAVV
uniref:Clusterin n=1 Tax=Myripristis murdjan TaxID=586833 RepID=A0A667XXI8_9TELE